MRGICYLNIIRLNLYDYDPPVTGKSSDASESQSLICCHKINAPLHSFKQVILKQFNSGSFFDQGSFFLDNDILLIFIDHGNDLLILNR